MKRIAIIAGTALVLALALTACGKDAATEATESGAAAATEAAERTVTGTLLRDSKEETAYLEVSDTEIVLWDSAAGGALLGTAKYPQALPGAEAALQSCDWTDLDEDGNSELTAEFSFSDGTTASLVWFCVDGGYVYNEEFSRLPGEPTAAGTN